MPVVAFEVLAATAPHASRKPAAPADREGSTPFSEMLDKPANKPTTKADKNASKDAGKAAPQQAAPVKAKDKVKDDQAPAAETKAPETAAATDVPTAEPAGDTTNTADAFVAAVADATGVPVAPAETAKSEAKTDAKIEAKSDDTGADTGTKSDKADTKDDDAVAAAVPTDAKSTPVAAVVTAPAEATADPAPADTAPADTAPATAALTVAIAEQGIGKAAVKTDAATGIKIEDKTDTETDAKTGKPQVAVKLDTPPLLTDPLHSAKQAADPQTAQPQQAQVQGLKPADAQAQAAKPAPAPHHDTPAPDAAVIAKPADATQPLLLAQNNVPAPQSADQAAVTAAPAAAPQAVALPVQGIAIEIAGRALDGKKSFDIRLDPPELGKIHVRLDVDHKGEVTSIITADRSDTFDLLRRDAQSLERALNDAGVKTSSGGLQFSLRDQSQQQNTPAQFTDTARIVVRDNTIDTEITVPAYRPLAGHRAGVDIRV